VSAANPALDACLAIVEMGRGLTVDAVEAYGVAGERTRVTCRGTDEASLASGATGGVAVRVWRSGRVAHHAMEGVDVAPWRAALPRLAELAVQGAAAPPAEARAALPAPVELGIHDPSHAEWGDEQRIDWALTAARLARDEMAAAGQVDLVYEDVGESVGIASSLGHAGGYARTRYQAWAWVETARGHLRGATASRRWANLEPIRLEVRPARPGTVAPAALTDGPLDVLLPGWVAAHVARDAARLLSWETARSQPPLVEATGRRVAPPGLSLVDDPLLAGGLGTRPWDDEGRPVERQVLVRDGLLAGFLGRRTEAGVAWRQDYRRLPRAGVSNPHFSPGAGAGPLGPADLGRGLRVDSLRRLPGLSGARLHLAVGGTWIEDGAEAGATPPVALAIGLLAFLAGVRRVGGDLTFPASAGGGGSPSLVVSGFRAELEMEP
jgi:PmbA protein